MSKSKTNNTSGSKVQEFTDNKYADGNATGFVMLVRIFL